MEDETNRLPILYTDLNPKCLRMIDMYIYTVEPL